MAKVHIEENTAYMYSLRPNLGKHYWKIGSNFVIFYLDNDTLTCKYRYSSDSGVTWSADEDLVTITGNNVVREMSVWYNYVNTHHIIYIIYSVLSLAGTYTIYISKWNLDTINTPSQVGITYNLTTGASWTPQFQNHFTMASDKKLWVSGIYYKSGGSPYYEYFTIKATNASSDTGDSDINAWGTELSMGDADEGYDALYTGRCLIAGSLTTDNVLFASFSWLNSTTNRLRVRYGDGGNADGNWTPTPSSGLGTLYNVVQDSYIKFSENAWKEGTCLDYAPSQGQDVIWLAFDHDPNGFGLARFNLTSQTVFPAVGIDIGYSDLLFGICCVSRGGFDTIYCSYSSLYTTSVFSEEAGGISTEVNLLAGGTTRKGTVFPFNVTDQNDVFVIWMDSAG